MVKFVCLDESGAMHIKDEDFFIIGGFITNDIIAARSEFRKIEKEFKVRNNISLKSYREIKASGISKSDRKWFIERIFEKISGKPIAIIVDKKKVPFSVGENFAFNYFIKSLLSDQLMKGEFGDIQKIDLVIDERTMSKDAMIDLPQRSKLNFLQNKKVIEINFSRKKSSDFFEVRISDFIANMIYLSRNKNVTWAKEAEKNVCSIMFPF